MQSRETRAKSLGAKPPRQQEGLWEPPRELGLISLIVAVLWPVFDIVFPSLGGCRPRTPLVGELPPPKPPLVVWEAAAPQPGGLEPFREREYKYVLFAAKGLVRCQCGGLITDP